MAASSAPRPKIGAHVRSGGGVQNAIDNGLEMGAETIQIFSGAPYAWKRKRYTEAEVEAFKKRTEETGIEPAFIHGLYLVNLGSSDNALLARSVDALVGDMKAASLIGAKGVIFHLGSHMGAGYDAKLNQVVEYVRKVVDNTPDDSWMILENAAGMGGAIGSKFTELGTIIRESGSDRVRVCVDVQHAFAAGHDVKTRPGLNKMLDEFEREVGLDRLVAIHANDSKCPLGGGIDRHENIGDGHIGSDGFENLLSHPSLSEVPFLLEVPGIDDHGPDKENVERLKALRAAVTVKG
jgi:deoxyribonuclease-4